MDAVTYIKEYKRMCEYFDSKENPARACEGCPLEWLPNGCHMIEIADNAEKCVAAVEKWAREHPVKTRQSEFLKQWPNARLDATGCLMLCPIDVMGREYVSKNIPGCINNGIICDKCHRDFWLAEIKDEEA